MGERIDRLINALNMNTDFGKKNADNGDDNRAEPNGESIFPLSAGKIDHIKAIVHSPFYIANIAF